MDYIKNFLADLEPLKPTPAGVEPDLSGNFAPKAFVFDVYGTLLISDSGDIDENIISADNLRKAMEFSSISLSGNTEQQKDILNDLLDEFISEIKSFHKQHRTLEKPYPEIDIQEIWETIIRRNHAKGGSAWTEACASNA